MRFLPPARGFRCNTGDIRYAKQREARFFKKAEKSAVPCQIKIIPRRIRLLPLHKAAEDPRVTNRF